ncbi:MAG: hypothetical protein EOM73_04460 [Bacteroidia bacterium]|nr:hypothetical protein [Bacteroidia bacterium]
MGSPVEIEYAVDLEPAENGLPTFYLLQIKPLIRVEEQVDVDLENIDGNSVFMYTEHGMGNGIIETIRDVIYVNPEKFDKMKTRQMAQEISQMNREMEALGKDYILIGPGRWGSRDPYTGIPVQWANISKARVIIEMGLPGFPLDASLGSHFFHNVTSMNVGFFSVHHNSGKSMLKMEMLNNQRLVKETGFVRHVEFNQPLSVNMNGKVGKALIYCRNIHS